MSTLQRVVYARSCCAPSPATQEDATLYKRPSEVGVKPKGLFSHNENCETDVPLTQRNRKLYGNDLVSKLIAP